MALKKWNLCAIVVAVLSLSGYSGISQPYFDVAGMTTWYIPLQLTNSDVTEFCGTAFVALPVDVGKRNKIIFCPLFETRWWKSSESGDELSTTSMTMLFVWRHQSRDSSRMLTATFMPRTNSSELSVNITTLQPGGALLGTFRINPNLKLKFGLYYNNEYFGGYFMPLAGIDWKINERWNLFGVLPNTMKLEYKLTRSVYTGLSLKTITNSYRYQNEQGYVKIKDNHLCLFADFYLPKKITLMAEAGHTLLREVNNRSDVAFEEIRGNGFIFKAGIYYRVRFDRSE